MTLEPELKTPTDYAPPGPVEDPGPSAEPSQQDIEQVFSLADAARAAGAWSDDA